jgi:basic membrane protein A and related proteins
LRGKRVALAAAVAVLALTLVAGGSFAMTAPAAKGHAKATVKVAVVTDIGGLNDRGFNHLSNVGRLRAQKQLKVQTRVFVTGSAAERSPNLQVAAQQGYNLIIGVGFLMFDPLNNVAPAFPNVKFAGVDVPYSLLDKKPSNVRGLIFKEQEAGYLVGYIAGLTVKAQKGSDVVSAVGANKVPAIVRFIAGYRAGVKRADAKAQVLVDYANDPTFSDQAKCKETALNQIARGSKVVFQVAGQCGLGALNAAKEKKVWAIGVDADQSFFGSFVLTSATKKVDVSVYQTIRQFKRNPGAFRTRFDNIFSVKNGGVGYGKISAKAPKRAAMIKKVEAIKKLIAAGKIKIPTQ